MKNNSNHLLYELCTKVYKAQRYSEQERRKEAGLGDYIELLINKRDKVKIEIRAENVSHKEPHLHISHSDKIDVSLSLSKFEILAGKIDNKTYKKLLPELIKNQASLKKIWETLNVDKDALKAHRIISNLDLSI